MDDIEFLRLQASCVSHEIRNNVSICDMYSEIIKKHLVRDNYNNKSVNEAIKYIQKSLQLIGNSLLDLKMMNSPSPQKIKLKYLIETAVALAKSYVVDKDIKINVSSDDFCYVFADENKFLSCLINVIKNAVEAIQIKGEIDIRTDVNSKFACIYISNNGDKIDEDIQKEIFSQGFSTKNKGRGLGLYICKKSMNEFGADLNLVKSDDISTEFEIIAPRISEKEI